MRLLNGFGCFLCGSLAVLLCAPANPDRQVKAALAPIDTIAAFAHSDVALASPELRTALADPNTRAAVADPVIKVPLAEPELNVSPLEASDECVLSEECIDQYLWSVYERARKVDTIKVRLYHLFRALDDAGLAPGMTSGFRDDYRQSIASGNKAATNRSYHGGSLRGGYGHGLAADVVSVKGETRSDRCISSEILWKWIDAHGKEYGIGRPYLDKDPPHIAPIDGKEYADKRGVNAKLAGKGSAATGRDAKVAKSPQPILQRRAEHKP